MKIITINDLIYCFQQLNGVNVPLEEKEVQIFLPGDMPINKSLRQEGLELRNTILFERIDDSNKFRLKTKVDIVTQY